MMTDDREKWDGSKPKLPADEEAEKGERQKRSGDKDPGLEGPSTDAEDAKHDGP